MSRIAHFLLGAAFGAVQVLLIGAVVEPDCPTEDSCTVDYRDGQWHITEVTP